MPSRTLVLMALTLLLAACESQPAGNTRIILPPEALRGNTPPPSMVSPAAPAPSPAFAP